MNIDEEMKKFEQGFAYKPSQRTDCFEEGRMKINIEIEEEMLTTLRDFYVRSISVCDPLEYQVRQRQLLQRLAVTLLSALPDPKKDE